MTTIVKTNYIITPYYDEIIKDTNTPFWFLNQKHHHIPYQFFVLKTRLQPYVPNNYYIGFGHHRYFGVMQYTIVFSTTHLISLSKSEADKYQQIVDTITKTYPTYCTLIYFNLQLISTKYNTNISVTWVASVLPYCYKKLLSNYNVILYDGQILIELDANEYYEQYKVIQNDLIDTLYDMYYKGTVVANPISDADIIEKWNLVPFFNNNNNVQLYTINWIDARVSNNISEFLMERLYGNSVVILDNIKNNKYEKIYDKYYINVDSYDELTKLIN